MPQPHSACPRQLPMPYACTLRILQDWIGGPNSSCWMCVRPADQACVHLEPETCAADYLSLTMRGANDEQADTLPGSSKIDSVTGDSLPGIGPGTFRPDTEPRTVKLAQRSTPRRHRLGWITPRDGLACRRHSGQAGRREPQASVASSGPCVGAADGCGDRCGQGHQLIGVTVTHTAPVFLKTYMASLSGGDWSLRPTGAVILEGTKDALISHAKFDGVRRSNSRLLSVLCSCLPSCSRSSLLCSRSLCLRHFAVLL